MADVNALITLLAGVAGFAGGVAVTTYFARDIIRHKQHLERLAVVATLKRHADAIRDSNDPVDPRRIGYGLRLEAEHWQAAADALRSGR